jgi:uncharacterized protein
MIYVDADACPVKEEVYRVAARYGFRVFVVANTPIRIPRDDLIERVVVTGNLDAADDWIVERIADTDIVVTSDIPLASRSIKKGARALNPKGKIFTPESIGNALASRDLSTYLRSIGDITSGPSPFDKKDRSIFLQNLDTLIQSVLKQIRKPK